MTRNKKALIIAALGVLVVAAPTLVVAQQPQDRGGYLGLSLGRADYKNTCSGIAVACDDSDSAWRFFGGYQFSRGLALELGYANLGAVSASGAGVEARAEVRAWDLVGVGSFHFTPQFALFGKLGIYRSDVDSRGTVGSFTGNGSEKNTGFTYGAGVQYNFTRNLGLRAEWQAYDNVGGARTGEDDISAFSVGVVWKFQ